MNLKCIYHLFYIHFGFLQVSHGQKGCKDSVTGDQPLIINSSEGENIARLESCSELLTDDFGALCVRSEAEANAVTRERCCKTCRSVNTKCVNSLKAVFKHGEEFLKCRQYVAMNPCHCLNSFDIPGREKYIVRKECCDACDQIDNQVMYDCECQNKLSPEKTLIPFEGGPEYDNCEEMIGAYPELCREYGLMKKQVCCEVCQGVDMDCLDQRLLAEQEGWMSVRTGAPAVCKDIVKDDRCQCVFFTSGECCQSCGRFSEQDLEDCCSDNFRFRLTLKRRAFSNGKKSCSDCTCAEVYELVGDAVMTEICEADFNNAASQCCSTCHQATSNIYSKT